MSKRIFIIGANSALAKTTITSLSTGGNSIITAGRKNCDVYCDITQPFTIPDGIDVVLNFAATFGGTDDGAIMDAMQTNALGVLHICMAAKQAGVLHVVNISSLSALHSATSPYFSIYALTKRQADELAAFYCALNDVPLTIIRPSQVYGDTANFSKHQPLFYYMMDRAEEGKEITLYGTHDALRNYINAVDVGEIIGRIIARTITGTYACLYPKNVRLSSIARLAQQAFGNGGKTIFLEDQLSIPDNIFDMDLSIYEKIDYHPQVTLKAGIESIRLYRRKEAA